jgi:shikimate kinase
MFIDMKHSYPPKDKCNLVLIGMCGVGKSTIGVLLAKALNMSFVDTDVCIQTQAGMSLQKIMERIGSASFCKIEERYLLDIQADHAVIATGGSAVHSPRAMEHLSKTGLVVYLYLDYKTIKKRVDNPYARGVVLNAGQTLQDLFKQRQPLYQRYAHYTIDCVGKGHDRVVAEIIGHVGSLHPRTS